MKSSIKVHYTQFNSLRQLTILLITRMYIFISKSYPKRFNLPIQYNSQSYRVGERSKRSAQMSVVITWHQEKSFVTLELKQHRSQFSKKGRSIVFAKEIRYPPMETMIRWLAKPSRSQDIPKDHR